VRAASVSSGRINVLWSEWAEKRKESTHYGQISALDPEWQAAHWHRHLYRSVYLVSARRWAAVARTLQATPPEIDLLYLCDSGTTLDKVSRWIGSGPRTTLAGDANAEIMKTIIECVREECCEVHAHSWSRLKRIEENP
jgi:hypothetical protein